MPLSIDIDGDFIFQYACEVRPDDSTERDKREDEESEKGEEMAVGGERIGCV